MLNSTLNQGRIGRTSGAYPTNNPVITCKDGFSVSVQCSEFHYCNPRKTYTDVAKYESFELGFPSELDPLIAEYAEEKDTVETVFGRVPRDIVEKLLMSHGGVE